MLPREAVQPVLIVRVGAAVHASVPCTCAAPVLDSRKVVLHTMSTFMVRVRVKEVFMDRIIVFMGQAQDKDYG
jgi:hypothetical protein